MNGRVSSKLNEYSKFVARINRVPDSRVSSAVKKHYKKLDPKGRKQMLVDIDVYLEKAKEAQEEQYKIDLKRGNLNDTTNQGMAPDKANSER